MIRILVTGASSPLAVGVMRQLLLNSDIELWAGRHRKDIPLSDPRLHVIDLDLESDLTKTLSPFDMVLHFAGVTHASDEQQYWKVNLEGTRRLAYATHETGCRRFVYISTRCATHGSGAYGESKLAAEQELLVAGTLERSIGQSAVPGVPASSPHLLEAAKRRLALWDISDAQIEEILHSGHVRRTLTLYAPTSGIVLEKHIVQGQAFEPGQMLYRIAKLDTVWLNAEVREVDAGVVREGSRATAELAAYPGRSFTGRVAYVYPTLDSAARSLGVRIEMPNPHGLLKLGMYATVHITTPVRTALTIRTSAVLRTGTRALVFVDMGNGRLMPRDIVLGTVAGDYVEVRSGLEPGQRVVTSAQFLLDSESNLAEVMKSMIGEMNMPTGGHTAPRSDMQDMRDTPGMQMPSDSSTR